MGWRGKEDYRVEEGSCPVFLNFFSLDLPCLLSTQTLSPVQANRTVVVEQNRRRLQRQARLSGRGRGRGLVADSTHALAEAAAGDGGVKRGIDRDEEDQAQGVDQLPPTPTPPHPHPPLSVQLPVCSCVRQPAYLYACQPMTVCLSHGVRVRACVLDCRPVTAPLRTGQAAAGGRAGGRAG